MDNAKLKNILIIILALVNAFLLFAVAADRVEAGASRSRAAENAVQVLENSSVTVAEGVDANLPAPQVYSVKRDAARENSLVASLLGRTTTQDLGGNIYLYSSDKGQASLRGTGEMDVLFTAGAVDAGSDPAASAAKLMKKLGMAADKADAAVSADEGGGTKVTLPCSFQGQPVYNAEMTFTFTSDSLLMMSGTRIFDTAAKASGNAAMDSLSALMRFVEIIRGEGYVCSELRGLGTGYLLSVPVSGESTLTPVWHFVTDTGDLYVNAVTGKTETVG